MLSLVQQLDDSNATLPAFALAANHSPPPAA